MDSSPQQHSPSSQAPTEEHEPSVGDELAQIERDIQAGRGKTGPDGGDPPDSESGGGSTQSRGGDSIDEDMAAWLLRSSNDLTTIRPGDIQGEFSTVTWTLPPGLTIEQWAAAGIALGRMERAVGWWIGDWWTYGEHEYRERTMLVRDPRWTGPSLQTCRNAAVVSRAFETSRRRDVLSFTHHMEVCALPATEADRLLDAFVAEVKGGKPPPPTRQLRQIVKRDRRDERERQLGERTTKANETLAAEKKYAVIYADPPWRFEPRSRETGMDRSPDNHYPTMTTADIYAMSVPAAPDAVLFLWATAPMLPQALAVMDAWGFEYKSNLVWHKDTVGTGYWARNNHEMLLIGTRGEIPAPAMGDQPVSCMIFPVGEHSQKPREYAEMIEGLFPSVPKLEMFARQAREGWDAHGNQVPEPAQDIAAE